MERKIENIIIISIFKSHFFTFLSVFFNAKFSFLFYFDKNCAIVGEKKKNNSTSSLRQLNLFFSESVDINLTDNQIEHSNSFFDLNITSVTITTWHCCSIITNHQ